MLDKQCYMHARACIRPRVRAARARAHTHTQICNTAFLRQLWLHERASTLRYTYIACLVSSSPHN